MIHSERKRGLFCRTETPGKGKGACFSFIATALFRVPNGRLDNEQRPDDVLELEDELGGGDGLGLDAGTKSDDELEPEDELEGDMG